MHKTGMVFGVFDGLHPGHEFLLREASARCEKLTVVVARDEEVLDIKKKLPRNQEQDRMKRIKEFFPEAKVMLSDKERGSWQVLHDHKPDMIFLGYDQQGIASELEKQKVPFIFLEPHEPHKYKSSLM